MGCFTVLKGKKNKPSHIIHIKHINEHGNIPTTLPEPQMHGRSLQSAPPSFRTRANSKQQSNSRTRVLSAPSSLDAQEDPASFECDEQDESISNHRVKEFHAPCPRPLPLPSPQTSAALKCTGSFKSGSCSGPLYASGPLPLPPSKLLRSFSYEEIVSACHNFSPDRCLSESLSSMIYKASFGDDATGPKKIEATVTRLHQYTQSAKEFINEADTLAFLQHPNLCKLLGYHAREGSDQRMLVYERLYYGGLDKLLFGRSDGPPIDWNTRMKVALCAAQGLAFLHEEGPFQAMYNDFSAANIQIDKDFRAKLSGYGCAGSTEISSGSFASASLSVETLERGVLTPKSNVWSFGIVLLELLTGRRNLDSLNPNEEKNLVKWSRPFLSDDSRLSLIMDPQLKLRFPAKAARTVADMAQRCLQIDPSERPTMRSVVENLKIVQDMRYSCRFPLQEPICTGKHMARSPSLNGIVVPRMKLGFSPSPALASLACPISLPCQTCSSALSSDEIERTVI